MSDIGLSNTVSTSANANAQNNLAQAGANGGYDGALHAGQHGASLTGSGSAGVSGGVTPPDLPHTPDVAGHVTGTVDAMVEGVRAHAQAALDAVGGLPDWSAMLHGAVTAMAHASASVGASVSGLFGF